MKNINIQLLTILAFWIGHIGISIAQSPRYDFERDLLLVQYDFKTDIDDLHSAAAFATLVSNSKYADLSYHAVAGAYGIQEGLYVPPVELMELVFGEKWSDAHSDFDQALTEVATITLKTLDQQGEIWIAEGGQSDFSAALVMVIQKERPELSTVNRIHIVQHAGWNEEVTSQDKLVFVKEQTSYQKIPDGNAVGNGTPGFRSDQIIAVADYISDERLLSIWQLAIDLGNQYNGKQGRYLNESVQAGGLDFSDFSEVCWILGLQDLKDAEDFFGLINNDN